jgi:Fe-S cluster assembly protein SufD
MLTQITSSLYDQFIAEFETRASLKHPAETASLTALRESAFSAFKRLGFPSTKVEDWKYTNLAPFLKELYDIDSDTGESSLVEAAVSAAKIPELDCYRLVLVNGQYRADLSDIIQLDGVFVLPIAEAAGRPAFKSHFGQYAEAEKNHFVALNTALFSNGLFIEIRNKIIVDKPIHIIHVAAPSNNLFLQPRHLFVAGMQSDVSIAESYITAGGNNASVFINHVSEIVVAENARVQHYYIQTGDVRTRYVHFTEVRQERSSLYNNYKASFPGTGLLRNNLNIVLDGENIESHLYGIYLAGGRQLIDNHTLVDHRKPHCQSNELYKGVMKDESVGVFNGKIFVRHQAQKTNAFQQNNNLMLSKKAVVDSKPQLEIFADDVKCSHGSTIGQFNDEALFYLKSRGIGAEKAKALLIHAFAFDVTEKIPLPAVQAHINHLIEEGLVAE